ncbi:MAG TPA: HAMP domain-containing histidine kinase, partial [Bacteroidetes bacterium]|nr:HAMP domain-containing histidine kinase [Bacteroidota bacterium]
EQAKHKQIKIILNTYADPLVQANKNLAEILFSNLLLNAIQHNIENGVVQIEVFDDKALISNTSDLPKIPNDQLFNRFTKSHKNQQGNGLGLAIVKKIADQQHWKISYSFSKEIHKFIVQF